MNLVKLKMIKDLFKFYNKGSFKLVSHVSTKKSLISMLGTVQLWYGFLDLESWILGEKRGTRDEERKREREKMS